MSDISRILAQATSLQWEIRRLLRVSNFSQYTDLSGLEIDYNDREQLFLLDELRSIMEKLSEVDDALRYINLPVQEVSQLHKNTAGRYETAHGRYFCCGSPIEALVSDDRYNVPYWARTRVEHDDTGYYLVGHRGVSMDGLTVRIREEP